MSDKNKISARTLLFETVKVDAYGNEILRFRKTAECILEEIEKNVSLEMIKIPGGSFLMGSSKDEVGRFGDEIPQHKVRVSPFYIGRYPITQEQWNAVAKMQPVKKEVSLNPFRSQGRSLPAECVSWHDAVEFCERLTRHTQRIYRLPSEVEWEYACRAEATTPFCYGPTMTTDLANYCGEREKERVIHGEKSFSLVENLRAKTTRVGSFLPNSFGLYDMHGNVEEWCIDTLKEEAFQGFNYTNAVIKGGSFLSEVDECRCAYRDSVPLEFKDFFVGFRVCCTSL